MLFTAPYVETSVRYETTHTMVNITENVTEIRNATNATTNLTYAYNWTRSVMTLTNVSTNTSVEVNTTRTPVAQTTVCGDPLGTTDATHPQKVSVTFVGTSFGRGNDVPQLVVRAR